MNSLSSLLWDCGQTDIFMALNAVISNSPSLFAVSHEVTKDTIRITL